MRGPSFIRFPLETFAQCQLSVREIFAFSGMKLWFRRANLVDSTLIFRIVRVFDGAMLSRPSEYEIAETQVLKKIIKN